MKSLAEELTPHKMTEFREEMMRQAIKKLDEMEKKFCNSHKCTPHAPVARIHLE